jgi:hypothetical protein
MAALKASAKTWPGENVSAFTEYLINKALRVREEEARNRSLRALNYFIAKLGEKIGSPVFYFTNDPAIIGPPPNSIPTRREQDKILHGYRLSDWWRTDPFRFRAFKAAVRKLLDTLEEPPGELRSPVPEHVREKVEFGEPWRTERMRKALRTPEEYGAFIFAELWAWSESSATQWTPLSDLEKQFHEEMPLWAKARLDQAYTLPKARGDLELKRGKSQGQRQ